MFFSVVKRGMPKSLRSCHCATSLSPKCANSLILTPIYIRSFSPFISLPFRIKKRDLTYLFISCFAVIAERPFLISFLVCHLAQKREKSPENQAFSLLYSMVWGLWSEKRWDRHATAIWASKWNNPSLFVAPCYGVSSASAKPRFASHQPNPFCTFRKFWCALWYSRLSLSVSYHRFSVCVKRCITFLFPKFVNFLFLGNRTVFACL